MEFDKTIRIEDKLIGENNPVFIVAEAGVNHNGDIETAKHMIEVAASCGVNCVKFQTFNSDEFMSDKYLTYSYKVKDQIVTEKMYDMFKRLEFSIESYKILFDYCRRYGMIPLTSVADRKIADLMQKAGIGAFKISSEDFINLPLVEHVARKKIPLILSTGMANKQEINDVLNLLNQNKKGNVAFLHCTSIYPTPDNEANLLRIRALKRTTKALIGYSDHTMGMVATVGAVSLGACIIEKHFTLDRNMHGPDHYFSADTIGLTQMVDDIRRIEKSLGKDKIKISPLELRQRKKFRRSIVAAKNLEKGHILKKNDLALKRPGNGLHPRNLIKLYNKRLAQSVAEDQQIRYEDIL